MNDSSFERSKIMEVPYEREEEQEELIGVDLQTRRQTSHSHHSNKNSYSSISSDSSSNITTTSELTEDISSFEYSESMNTIDNNTSNNTIIITDSIITNGENPNIIEGRSVIEEAAVEADEEEPIKKDNNDINVAQNGDSNGFTVKQNGDTVVQYSLPENNADNEETDIGPITSSFSKIQESTVGLKYVESLLDESSNDGNVTLAEAYNSENIVNKTLIVNGQNEIVETGHNQEVEPEVEEFDVERVIQKQETHDFYCPNCNLCITKRVILKRRKRKIEEISKDESRAGRAGQLTPMDPDDVPAVDERKREREPFPDERATDARLDAMSCFSCFSIFVPKGDGFLCWRFKPKSAVSPQPGDAQAESTGPMETEIDDGRGTVFPLWILTCCQPYRTEEPVTKPGPRHPPTTDDGTEVLPNESEIPSPPSHDTPITHKAQPHMISDPDLPPSTGHVEDILSESAPLPPVTSDGGKDFPLWFLTCCQPSTDGVKPEHAPKPGAEVPIHETKSPSAPSDDISVPATQSSAVLESVSKKHLSPINPADEIKLPVEQKVPATSYEGKEFPLWFLTCCQPASEGSQQKHQEVSGLGVPPHEREHPSSLSQDNADSTVPSTQPSKTPTYDAESPLPHEQKPLVIPERGSGFPLWLVTCCQPSIDGIKLKPPNKSDETEPLLESKPPTYGDDTGVLLNQPEPPAELSSDTGVLYHERELPAAPSDDVPVPSMSQSPIKSEPGQLLLSKPISSTYPGDDIPSPPEPEAPGTPPQGDVIVPFPEAPKLQPSVTWCDPSESGPSLDVIVAISDEPMPQPPVTYPDPPESGPSIDIKQSLLERPGDLSRPGVSGLDIIKAIVYGGLLECITSLSVITSAAGGDATTLNIVALGLANVFGGLVVLLHSLRVLKHEHATERYEDQLGRPGHYLVHAVVAVLSYLVFGLLSPVIYGFAFRKSDNKDYKLATLAAASLACITILSIAKAYVRKPPKSYIKTVFYYVLMGFMVSGVGYVAGDLINMLLKKFGIFDSREPVTMPLLEAGALKGAWSSY